MALEATADVPAREINPCPLEELRVKYGWTAFTRPHSQIYATRDVVYIGAEMPSDLPKDQQKEYATLLLRDSLPQEYIDRIRPLPCDLTTDVGRKKAMLSVSAFDIELGDVNRTVVPCGNVESEEDIGVIFIMGDARKNPLYTTGTGAQTGVREVMHFDVFLTHQNSPAPSLHSDSSAAAAVSDGSLSASSGSGEPFIDSPVSDGSLSASSARDEPVMDVLVPDESRDDAESPLVVDRGPAFDINLAERLSRYHANVRGILDHVSGIQDQWIMGRHEKNKEAEINHHLFKRNEDNIRVFCKYVHKVNEVLAAQDAGARPEFLIELQGTLNRIRASYNKVFECAHDEGELTSYNGMNIEAMLQEIAQLQEAVLSKYPRVDDVVADKSLSAENRVLVADCYKKFIDITKHLIQGTLASDHAHDDHPEGGGADAAAGHGLSRF